MQKIYFKMKHIKVFEQFVNENNELNEAKIGKMSLNTTIPASNKDYTWVYQTGKDAQKTAVKISKNLNDMGINSFVSKETGDSIAIPTKDIQKAFDEVLSKYDNMNQFAYSDHTKLNKDIVNESQSDFQVYHNQYSSAIDEIEKYAKKMGYELDREEYANAYTDAFFKPKDGQTKKDTLTLYKNGKEQRKALHVQIYGMGNKFELNAYIN